MPRVHASLVEWKPEKGYGFARLPGGTERVFVHARAFAERSSRPKRGDALELDLVKSKKGLSAENVRLVDAGELANRLPYHLVTATMLLILVQLDIILGKAPFYLAVHYALMGAVSIYLYGHDKQAAIAGLWRVSETRLLLVDLFGGIIGGLIAQHRYWHKMSKEPYQQRIFVVVAIHALFLAALGSGLLRFGSFTF